MSETIAAVDAEEIEVRTVLVYSIAMERLASSGCAKDKIGSRDQSSRKTTKLLDRDVT